MHQIGKIQTLFKAVCDNLFIGRGFAAEEKYEGRPCTEDLCLEHCVLVQGQYHALVLRPQGEGVELFGLLPRQLTLQPTTPKNVSPDAL